MARPLRIEFPGAFYHVMHRGNAGEIIFKSIRDREIFLEYISKAVERFGVIIHTYCLMNNHYHLLVETPLANLSQAIKWVNVSYAAYFNRKRNRSGHLFQGRFKSILVDADEYLKELSRYIHLNPLRAKIVDAPAEYEWSSYPAFIGRTKSSDWFETDWLLSVFGKNRKMAAKNYQSFVEKVDVATLENPAKELTGGFILGSVDFVDWVQKTFLSKRPIEKEITQLKQLKPRLNADDIVSNVCDIVGCERNLILQKGRKKNLARDMAIYLARDLTGQSGVELGKYFGNICGAAITLRYNYINQKKHTDRKLKVKIEEVKNKIINN